MFTRKSTSQFFCSIFRWQCLRLCQHHTSLSQWLQIRCYFLSHKLRHKSQNPFLLSFQYIGGGYQAHNMKVLELNKCLRRTCPQKMRGAGERRASCQLSSGHLCQLYLRTWENRGIPVWTIDELYLNYTCNENGRISAAASVPNRISCIPPRAHQISPELQV